MFYLNNYNWKYDGDRSEHSHSSHERNYCIQLFAPVHLVNHRSLPGNGDKIDSSRNIPNKFKFLTVKMLRILTPERQKLNDTGNRHYINNTCGVK